MSCRQISKILEYPAPRAGEMIKLDAGMGGESMEVVCRFPGGLDFGRGLVDVNVRPEISCSFSGSNDRPRTQFTMWPLFQCLNIDNILTICEVCISPSLFKSSHA